MSAITAATDELTPAAVWQGVGGGAIGDELRDLRRGWGDPGIDRLVHRTLRTAVEQRLARVTSVPVTRG